MQSSGVQPIQVDWGAVKWHGMDYNVSVSMNVGGVQFSAVECNEMETVEGSQMKSSRMKGNAVVCKRMECDCECA